MIGSGKNPTGWRNSPMATPCAVAERGTQHATNATGFPNYSSRVISWIAAAITMAGGSNSPDSHRSAVRWLRLAIRPIVFAVSTGHKTLATAPNFLPDSFGGDPQKCGSFAVVPNPEPSKIARMKTPTDATERAPPTDWEQRKSGWIWWRPGYEPGAHIREHRPTGLGDATFGARMADATNPPCTMSQNG